MDRLARFLELDDALLIVSGFGFGDEHINNVIFGALENRPRTHVYALQYGEQGDDADLAKRSYQRRNMIVVGPDTGIIGGRRARWGLAEGHTFVEAAFEVTTKQQESQGGSNAAGTPDGFRPDEDRRLRLFLRLPCIHDVRLSPSCPPPTPHSLAKSRQLRAASCGSGSGTTCHPPWS